MRLAENEENGAEADRCGSVPDLRALKHLLTQKTMTRGEARDDGESRDHPCALDILADPTLGEESIVLQFRFMLCGRIVSELILHFRSVSSDTRGSIAPGPMTISLVSGLVVLPTTRPRR